MDSMYYIKVSDKTTNNVAILDIIDMQHVKVSNIHDGLKEDFELDFSDSNPGIVEDLVKVAEYLKIKLGSTENIVESEIYTSSIEFDGDDALWECVIGAIRICEGEYRIQQGSLVLSKGYDLIEQYVKIN